MRDDGPRAADAYAAQRVQEALAQDPRVSTLGLEVRLVGTGEVVVTGEVTTPDQRDGVADVVAEALPGRTLRNQVVVTPVAEAAGVEELP